LLDLELVALHPVSARIIPHVRITAASVSRRLAFMKFVE